MSRYICEFRRRSKPLRTSSVNSRWLPSVTAGRSSPRSPMKGSVAPNSAISGQRLIAYARESRAGSLILLLPGLLDRLGRSLRDLVAFLGELHAKGIDLYLHQQGIDTTTPAGKAMFQMMGVFAEFERAMIVERVKSGLARARAAGKRLGRPTIPRRKEEAVRRLLVSGTGIVKTAKTALVLVSALRNASRPNSARKQHWRPS